MGRIQVSAHSFQTHVRLVVLAKIHKFLSITNHLKRRWRRHFNLRNSCDFLACIRTPCDYLLRNLEGFGAFLQGNVTFASEDLDIKDLKEDLCLQLAVFASTYLWCSWTWASLYKQFCYCSFKNCPTIWMPPTQNAPDLLVLTAEGHQNKGTWHGGGINLLTAVWRKAFHFLFMSRLKRFRNTWKRCSGERSS